MPYWKLSPVLSLCYVLFAGLALFSCGKSGGGGATAQATVSTGSFLISPASGAVGTIVTISGGPFAPSVFENQVSFGPVSANVGLASPSTLVVSVPFGAKTGPISVTAPGTSFAQTAPFVVMPAITALVPASASIGTTMTIQGSALHDAIQVTIGGVDAPISLSEYDFVTVTIPPGVASGSVQVLTQDGVAQAAVLFKVLPSVLGFFPSQAKQGDSITILGTSLQAVQSVSFGGVDALSFQNPDSGTVIATIPPGAGSGPIVVTTADGPAVSPGNLLVLPTFDSLTPGSGIVGASVSIEGTAFFGVTEVAFGLAPASFTVNDSFSLSATVPLDATSGPISVTTDSGVAVSPGSFTVLPALLSFNPTSAVEGSLVTIQGTSFQGVLSVSFGGIGAGSFGNPDSQTLTAAVPPGAKTGPISVTTTDGQTSSVGSFVVTPFAADFLPKVGPVGAEVTITGTTFVNVTGVSFDGLDAASFTNPDDNTIVAVVPDGAASGPIFVTTQDGATQSAQNFSAVYPRFVWAVNGPDGTISEFTQNDKNGALRHAGFQVGVAQSNYIALHPSNSFAYVTNESANSVRVYQVDLGNGDLSAIQTVPAGTKPVSVALTPSGSFAYVSNEASGNISIFQVGLDGKLTALATANAGLKPRRLGMDPEGKFLYAPLEGNNQVAAFAIEANGLLTPIGNVGVGALPQHIVVDPAGKFAYVACDGSGRISILSIASDGTLTVVGTAGVAAKPRSLEFDYSGKFLFVTASGSGEIVVYRVQANGALILADKKSAGTAPESVVSDASGRFLSVAAKGSDEVHRFQLDRTTGLLTALEKVRTRSGPSWLAGARGAAPVAYMPLSAVWANEADGTISSATVSEANGSLTPADSEVSGSGISAIASDLAGKTLIVSSAGTDSLAAYEVEASGDLTLLDATSANPNAVELEIEPSGRFLYVANGEVQNNVRVFRIFGAGGVDLSGIQTFNLPPSFQAGTIMDPRASAMDPAGRFLFVLTSNHFTGGTILTFSVSPSNGQISLITPMHFIPEKEGTGLASDPQGRFLYALANSSPNSSVYGYRIDPLTGTLTFIATQSTDTKPYALAFEPTGRFLYVACLYGGGGNGSVLAYSKNATTGELANFQTISSGQFPNGISVDPSGKYVITNNKGSNDFSVFAIDAGTGVLTEVAGSPFANGGGSLPGPVFVSGVVQ